MIFFFPSLVPSEVITTLILTVPPGGSHRSKCRHSYHLLVETKCSDNKWLMEESLRIHIGALDLIHASPPPSSAPGVMLCVRLCIQLAGPQCSVFSLKELSCQLSHHIWDFSGGENTANFKIVYFLRMSYSYTSHEVFPYVQLIEETVTLLSVLFRRL